jgi:hypothetical protein
MNPIELKTYGEAADFLTKCDENDTPIYAETLTKKYRLPVDNYLLFKDFTSHDPEEYFPLIFWKLDNDEGYMVN